MGSFPGARSIDVKNFQVEVWRRAWGASSGNADHGGNMHRRSVLLSSLLASTAVGTVQAQAQHPAPQPDWQTITGPDGRYSFETTSPFKETSFVGHAGNAV